MPESVTLKTGTGGTDVRDTHAAIRRGLVFLAERQMVQGEFLTYFGAAEDLEQWAIPDAVTFTTALIGTTLLPWREDSVVRSMLEKAAIFLKYQIMSSGTWSYYNKWSKYFTMVSADVDDTACISFFLREMGVPFPDNREMFLDNRNREGLFYTWFVFRFQRSNNPHYWRVVLREFKRPFQTIYFWKKMETSRNGIHPIVNANVLFYFGRDPCTSPVIDWLLAIIAENREVRCDPWYPNPFVVYYAIARNYANGIWELEPARTPICHRITGAVAANGSIGNRPLNTALALTTLLWFHYHGPEIDAAACYLLSSQSATGSWRRQLLISGGPSFALGWGSEEISSALCVEALGFYLRTKTENVPERSWHEMA
jgi:hypothetical protein